MATLVSHANAFHTNFPIHLLNALVFSSYGTECVFHRVDEAGKCAFLRNRSRTYCAKMYTSQLQPNENTSLGCD